MFVCLSSGSRPRYRRDIARALALPAETWIQFRYAREWIAPGIIGRLDGRRSRKKLRGASSLIAYIDQADPGREWDIIPCRFASLVDAVPLGRTVSLQLSVKEFAFAADLDQLNETLRASLGELLPRQTEAGIEGCYWFDLDEPSGLARSIDLASWENIIEQIAARSDFGNDRFFYAVDGLADVSTDKVLRARKNVFKLRPARDYDLRLYHFHPSEGDPDSLVSVTASGAPVSFSMTPELLLDSRYDLKRIRFRTGSPVPGERGVLTLRRRRRSEAEWEWEFDVPLAVRGAFARQLGFGLLIAVFLAVTPIIAAYSNPNLSDRNQRIIAVVAAISSLLAGISAAFGLRRSL
jgi:hypothetical protein